MYYLPRRALLHYCGIWNPCVDLQFPHSSKEDDGGAQPQQTSNYGMSEATQPLNILTTWQTTGSAQNVLEELTWHQYVHG